ncbi:MAG: aldolase/citrate lyase family protein [Alphaproteobacteria bacterium]
MTKSLKARIAAGETTIGGWLSIPSPIVADALASLGFDWIAVDMEHGTMGVDAAAAAFIACERHGCAPLARMPSADPYLARRLLDAGAVGLVVPVVESAAAFQDFARHCVYPHAGGRRGVGLSRANQWGAHFQGYLDTFSPVLVPQIETAAGVAAAAALAALPEVDALFLGPYDLSADLGRAGDFSTPAFVAAQKEVRAACARHGKAPGAHQVKPDLRELATRLEEGFRFVAYGSDMIAMRHALEGFR